jgi:hypothetical protein
MYQVPETTISCAVIIYDKTSSSNYNVTAPIEQVQDKSIARALQRAQYKTRLERRVFSVCYTI